MEVYKTGYHRALEAAGANVLAYEEIGDSQGTWCALVDNGELLVVVGDYGSCSGCDAFEAEFSYSYEESADEGEKLKAFGNGYLNNAMTFEKFEAMVDRQTYDEGSYQKVLRLFRDIWVTL